MNPALSHAGSRIYKISSTLSKIIGDGGHSTFYSVKFCVLINFCNMLCFSFVVILYSMYSLYAIIKVVLLNERDCHVCNNNLRLKSPLTRSTDHKVNRLLLKHRNFGFAHFLKGGGGGCDSYLNSDFRRVG